MGTRTKFQVAARVKRKTAVFPASSMGIGNRFKVQVVEHGNVLYETPWGSNLILDQGMDKLTTVRTVDLFNNAAVGTGSTPTQDDSGSITATGDGTTVTSSAAFFGAGDVGKLLRFDSGAKAKITAFTDNQHVTCSAVQGSGQHFVMYRVTQVGLDAEVHRTNNYLTGAGNCGSTWSGNQVTHQRTYDFPIETSDQAYNEIGFSDSATAGANLNMRAILPSAPVTILTGQQLRVVYQVLCTYGPTTPTASTASISGWPSLQHSVAADAGTNLLTLVAHGFPDGMAFVLNGTTAPGGLTFGTTYYVKANTADTFYVAAAPGGAAIDLTSTGSGVLLFTNTHGTQQLVGIDVTIVASSGVTAGLNGGFGLQTEPVGCNTPNNVVVGLSTDTAPLPTWADSYASIGVFYSQGLTADTYTNGSFTRTARTTLATGSGNSSAIRKIGFGGNAYQAVSNGPVFFFDQAQEKTSLYTLTLVCRWTWDRVFS